MSWFDSNGWASMAKTALSSAQKSIDSALDIKDSFQPRSLGRNIEKKIKAKDDGENTDLFSNFGVSNLLASASSSLKTKEKIHKPDDKKKEEGFFSWSEWGKDDTVSKQPSSISENEGSLISNKEELHQDNKTSEAADVTENINIDVSSNLPYAVNQDTTEKSSAILDPETHENINLVSDAWCAVDRGSTDGSTRFLDPDADADKTLIDDAEVEKDDASEGYPSIIETSSNAGNEEDVSMAVSEGTVKIKDTKLSDGSTTILDLEADDAEVVHAEKDEVLEVGPSITELSINASNEVGLSEAVKDTIRSLDTKSADESTIMVHPEAEVVPAEKDDISKDDPSITKLPSNVCNNVEINEAVVKVKTKDTKSSDESTIILLPETNNAEVVPAEKDVVLEADPCITELSSNAFNEVDVSEAVSENTVKTKGTKSADEFGIILDPEVDDAEAVHAEKDEASEADSRITDQSSSVSNEMEVNEAISEDTVLEKHRDELSESIEKNVADCTNLMPEVDDVVESGWKTEELELDLDIEETDSIKNEDGDVPLDGKCGEVGYQSATELSIDQVDNVVEETVNDDDKMEAVEGNGSKNVTFLIEESQKSEAEGVKIEIVTEQVEADCSGTAAVGVVVHADGEVTIPDETFVDVVNKPNENLVEIPSLVSDNITDEVELEKEVDVDHNQDDAFSDIKQNTELVVEENEIQTSSDTLVLSEEDTCEFKDQPKSNDSFTLSSSSSSELNLQQNVINPDSMDSSCSDYQIIEQAEQYYANKSFENPTCSCDDAEHQSDQSSSSSLSSFVKFTNSEDDNQKASSSPTSYSSSDILKIDIGMMSGHTSGDEIETTTSSDIEIISSPNGGSSVSGCESRTSTKQFSHVSKTVLLQKGSKLEKNCEGARKRSISETSSEEADNMQPSPEIVKKMSDMAAVIDARESKLVEMSKENIQLKENNMELHDQFDLLQKKYAICLSEIDGHVDLDEKVKFSEEKVRKLMEENNDLKQKLRISKEEVKQRLCADEVQEALLEKEQQIKELMLEGGKLSKQQLQHSNIIKKLRAKEKESDETIKRAKDSLLEKTSELETIKKNLDERSEFEKKSTDNMKQLSSSIQYLEKELAQSRSDCEDVDERNKSLKFSLENSYKEIAELQKKVAEKKNEAENAVLSAEMSMKEKLKAALDQSQKSVNNERDNLISQIEELQMTISKNGKKANYRDEMLLEEIKNLQERLQITECRNDDVSQNISAATRPLLRQIENLQSTFTAQSQSFEVVEKNLTNRLMEAQRLLAAANEKETIATEKYMSISSHSSALESQNASLLREKTSLAASFEVEKSQIIKLEDEKNSLSAKINEVKSQYIDEISNLKKSKMEHAMEITVLKEKYEAEKKTAQYLQDQMDKDKNALTFSESSYCGSGANTPMSTSRFSSVSENPWMQDDVLSQSLMSLSASNPNKMSVYETLRSGSNTSSLIENLQSQLKQREGEISHLQLNIGNIERMKESIYEELVRLTTHNDNLSSELKNFEELRNQFKDMESQYNALLQMYGEKVEEAEELKMDLQDVKDMYRAQIDQLLQKNT